MIIPVYNVAPYLREALDSVICQTYANLEVIVVDDGSTDESTLICDEFLWDSRVVAIHQKNAGLSAARNAGLDLMTGNVVAFLDSDDAFYPQMIEVLLGEMMRSGADIGMCGYVWDTNENRPERASYDSGKALKQLVSGRMELAVWNKLYRSAVWDDVRFPTGYNYEGTRTTYKLLERASRIEVLPDCLMFHRSRTGSIVQTKSRENLRDYFLASRELEEYVVNHTPSLFTSRERNLFLEKRFDAHVLNWTALRSLDLALAEEVRKDVVRRVRPTESWRPKARVKYGLLRYLPSAFAVCYGLHSRMRVNGWCADCLGPKNVRGTLRRWCSSCLRVVTGAL